MCQIEMPVNMGCKFNIYGYIVNGTKCISMSGQISIINHKLQITIKAVIGTFTCTSMASNI